MTVPRPARLSVCLAALLAAAALASACGRPGASDALSGPVEIDGSSTVFPISEAVAEGFSRLHPSVRVVVGVSGTGGGFRRFVTGETDISNASRPIKDSERQTAQQNGVAFLELPVAFDGLSVVAHPDVTWADCLTVEELRRIWEPGSPVARWSQVRPEWPDVPMSLFGPGTDSGTFDYFTEAIVGEEDASRADYTASEDDNVLVTGVAGTPGALGYFGYAYYAENAGRVKLLGVDGGQGCVYPSEETINSGAYSPLSRPLYIYVSVGSLREKPQVREFVRFYLREAPGLVGEVGYVPLPAQRYQEGLARVEEALR